MTSAAATTSSSVFHALVPLPYHFKALKPYMSEETLRYHYGKHHAGYVNNLNRLLSESNNTLLQQQSLEQLCRSYGNNRSSVPVGIFNNAAQAFNHNFFWKCLTPASTTSEHSENYPRGAILDAINESFGSYEVFKEKFTKAASTHFGSGWAWLVKLVDEENVKNEEGKKGKLEVMTTSNADNPFLQPGRRPILVLDVWEHAYYIDYRNDRANFINNAWWKLVNWDFANANLKE